MRITKQSRRKAKQLLRSAIVDGVIDPGKIRSALGQMREANRRNYLATLTHLKRLIRLEEDRRTARIESAAALTAEEQTNLAGQLQRIYGHVLSVSFSENPALIGGVRIRVGSDIYDGSVLGRLKELEETF